MRIAYIRDHWRQDACNAAHVHASGILDQQHLDVYTRNNPSACTLRICMPVVLLNC